MNNAPKLTLVALVTSVVVACGSPPTPAADAGEELMQVSRNWAAAAATGNLDSIVSYWADDAVVIPPGQPQVVGKAAIREYVQAGASIPGFSITWAPEQVSISSAGDLGYLIEQNTVTYADSTGTIHTEHGRAVTIWRKDASGAWKCVVDTWNRGPDAAAASEPASAT